MLMKRRIQKMSTILVLFICTVIYAIDTNNLIMQLKKEYDKIDSLRSERGRLQKSEEIDLSQIKQNIFYLKSQIQTVTNDLNNPIFFKNDIKLDNNLDLVDFYMHEYTDNYYQAFARLKNKQNKYLAWVKLRFNFYKNGAFTGTDYAYIDFESYGSSGISPYNYSFINTFIDKVEFDSIAFQVEYDTENGDDDILWNQVLKLESVVINPSGNYYKWQGIVRNNYNYSMTFPSIHACILKDSRMIAHDYTYLDVQNNEMPANSSGIFDSYIDLPDSYDEIKYYINYALYSMEGSGNLPPNTPIFANDYYSGNTRVNTTFNAFVIDPDRDRIDLSIDFGDGYTSNWDGNFISGNIANVQYPYALSGDFSVRAKANDGRIETEWSENTKASIALSSIPEIVTTEISNATYKKYYNFQLQYRGGIAPVAWQIRNGILPDGLSLNSNSGSISGTPLRSGHYNFSVYCTDSGIPAVSDSVALQLEVNNQKPIITSLDSINTFINTHLIYTASATDPDNNSITFEFLNYPDWLSVSNSTLSGITPNQILETFFTLIATDGDLSDTTVVVIVIRTKPLTILSEDISDAVYKKEYHDSLQATGGLAPYSWSIIKGNLPVDLNFSRSGILSGIPDSSGHFQLIAQVQDSDSPPQADSLLFAFNVINNSPQITSSDTISIKKLQDFVYFATAIDPDGNKIYYDFLNYPSWLLFSDSLLIGNVPLAASDTSFTVIASDGDLSDSLAVKVFIKEPSSVNTLSIPTQFRISENYPNPFNSNTSIKIELPESIKIELFIHDVNGKLLDKLHVGQLNAGSHIFTWHASNISSGIYFIRLRSDKFNKVVKCTLLK